MTKPFEKWTVLPHGGLTAVEENIQTVVGELPMPLVKIPRRMTVVRLADGRLVIFNSIALDEAEMRALEAFGTPAWLIVPNDHHRLDAKVWAQRYPTLQVVAPAGAASKVGAVVAVDTSDPNFGDPDVQFITVAGTHGQEAALLVTSESGTTLVLNDLIANVSNAEGFGGWLLKLMGFGVDAPEIPAPVKAMLLKEKSELRQQLLEWAALPSLKRIMVAHGDMIETDARAALERVAATLV